MRMQVYVLLAIMALTVAVAAGQAMESLGTMPGLAVGVLGLALIVGTGMWVLRKGRHTPWPEAEAALADGAAVALWKPGCSFCELLLRALADDERVVWVNVWRDDDANQRVRELNDGAEYTPTVLVGDTVLRNPSAAAVREALSAAP